MTKRKQGWQDGGRGVKFWASLEVNFKRKTPNLDTQNFIEWLTLVQDFYKHWEKNVFFWSYLLL